MNDLSYIENNEAILELNNLSKMYQNGLGIYNLNLSAKKGNIIGLLGPNGSGKTTLIKTIAGLLAPTAGELKICGMSVSTKTKALVSYLPDKDYLNENMKIKDIVKFFSEFYSDFDAVRAEQMLNDLDIDTNLKLSVLSKGTREKVQLILVMSRNAKIYLLDEPIGGVDPAARDYILDTIIKNYNPDSIVIISTHLISDIEKILDRVVFIKYGKIILDDEIDKIREENNKSIDALFREVFKC